MHILILPSWYKSSENPVFGSFFEEQARALMKKNHQVGMIAPSYFAFSSSKKNEIKFINDDNLPTYFISYKAKIPRARLLNYHLYARFVFKVYQTYVKQFGKPDVIHAHTIFYAGIAAQYIAQKTKTPLIITEHYTDFITGKVSHPFDIKISRKIFQKANQNLVVSSSFQRLLAEKLQLPVDLFQVLHNLVSPIFQPSGALNKDNLSKPFRFFTTSFIDERKNHDLMIQAFHLFQNEFPHAKFIIGGDGEIRKNLENQVEKLGLKDKIIFKGLQSRKEVLKEMQRCDVFLLASEFETFGVVLIEALACGKPIISTDSFGPRDIVNSKNGILVKSYEVKDFAEAMKKIYQNYQDYSSKEISKECFERFSETKIIEDLIQIYREISVIHK